MLNPIPHDITSSVISDLEAFSLHFREWQKHWTNVSFRVVNPISYHNLFSRPEDIVKRRIIDAYIHLLSVSQEWKEWYQKWQISSSLWADFADSEEHIRIYPNGITATIWVKKQKEDAEGVRAGDVIVTTVLDIATSTK